MSEPLRLREPRPAPPPRPAIAPAVAPPEPEVLDAAPRLRSAPGTPLARDTACRAPDAVPGLIGERVLTAGTTPQLDADPLFRDLVRAGLSGADAAALTCAPLTPERAAQLAHDLLVAPTGLATFGPELALLTVLAQAATSGRAWSREDVEGAWRALADRVGSPGTELEFAL